MLDQNRRFRRADRGGIGYLTIAETWRKALGRSFLLLARKPVVELRDGGKPVVELVDGGKPVVELVDGGKPVVELRDGGKPVVELRRDCSWLPSNRPSRNAGFCLAVEIVTISNVSALYISVRPYRHQLC